MKLTSIGHNLRTWRLLLALLLSIAPALAPALAHSAALRVTWDANQEPDLEGYLLYWGTVPGQYGSPIAVPREQTTYRLENLAPATNYYLSLKATNSSGLASSFAPEVSAATLEGPQALPSDWAARYGINPADTAKDKDRDAYTNWEEYEGGTDPTDCRSVPGPQKTRQIAMTIRSAKDAWTVKAVDKGAGLTWTTTGAFLYTRLVSGVTYYYYSAKMKVPCGLRVEMSLTSNAGKVYPLSFWSDPNKTLLTPYIKISPLNGLLGAVSLGQVTFNYSKVTSSCSKNPLTQVDRDDDGIADYNDPDYLNYLLGL
jgi:hypothetical protein